MVRLLIALVTLVAACGTPEKHPEATAAPAIDGGLGALVADADRVELCFTRWPEGSYTDRLACRTLAGPDEVERLAEMVSARVDQVYKCGYHASLRFMRGDATTLDIDLNLSPACPHGLFIDPKSGALASRTLTPEGRAWLSEQRQQATGLAVR